MAFCYLVITFSIYIVPGYTNSICSSGTAVLFQSCLRRIVSAC